VALLQFLSLFTLVENPESKGVAVTLKPVQRNKETIALVQQLLPGRRSQRAMPSGSAPYGPGNLF
jgi:hypothetical protein